MELAHKATLDIIAKAAKRLSKVMTEEEMRMTDQHSKLDSIVNLTLPSHLKRDLLS